MPTVSVIIAAHAPGDVLTRCLDALFDQPGIATAEVLVALSGPVPMLPTWRTRFPAVAWIHHPAPRSLPDLRGEAVAQSRGAIVAILDPFSMVQPGWLAHLKRAHTEASYPIIGGPVALHDAAVRSSREWALYINEYGMFMPPMANQWMDILPGSNISYKRAVLFEGDTPRFPRFWKTFVNEGHPLWLAADVVVALDKPIPMADFLRTRYHHGRCYGGMRVAKAGWGIRLARAASAPLVPFVLLGRWGTRYWRKRTHRGPFLRTLPWQLLLFGNWARGELVGYLRGPGTSCQTLYY